MLLQVQDVYKGYSKRCGIIRKEKIPVLKGVSLQLDTRECLGIIGESGSGKSTLGRLIIGVEKPDNGTILINNIELNSSGSKAVKKDVSVVFQDYFSSVNPRFKVMDIIAEPIRVYENLCKKETTVKIINLLEKVGLAKEFLARYPHELSGGQLQRVCIARAIATEPKFIVLDEAISSLDVSVQVQVLDLLIKLKKDIDISYIFITHDLTAVTYICDRVIFFHAGTIVEEATTIGDLKDVKAEYSKSLLQSATQMNLQETGYEKQRIS